MTPNQVLIGDCLEVLGSWPDKCVDLTLTSPPYEKARTYGIDFKLSGQAWVDWMLARIKEMVRVTRGLVCVVCEGQTRNYRYSCAPILLMADLHRAGYNLRKPPIFHRVGIPGSGGPDWLRNDYEFCVCITPPGQLPWSDNTAMGHPPRWAPGGAMSHRISNGTRKNQRGSSADGKSTRARDVHGVLSKANPGNIIQEKYTADEVASLLREASDATHHLVGGGVMGDRICHENEAPFPETLAEFFIRSFCPPGGIVCDPFSGSGTTAAVAARNGRNWVAIDIRESQVELTNRRISDIVSDFPLLREAT